MSSSEQVVIQELCAAAGTDDPNLMQQPYCNGHNKYLRVKEQIQFIAPLVQCQTKMGCCRSHRQEQRMFDWQ